jgi:hypothetical protein
MIQPGSENMLVAIQCGACRSTDNRAHAYARSVADSGRYLPGSQQFNDAFNKSVTTSISDDGSQFADKSSVYQFEGQYNLSPYIKVVDVLIGGSYRWYILTLEVRFSLTEINKQEL